MRRGLLAGVGVVASVLAGVSAAGADIPGPVTVSFSYTGGEQNWQVPPGVHTIHVVATGARGDAADSPDAADAATVTTDLSVTPRATLYIEVGGPGSGQTGGFNGGGDGGDNGNTINGDTGGGGGGASDIQTCSNIGDPNCDFHANPGTALVVAAGSGGGGGSSTGGGPGAPGAAGQRGGDAADVSNASAAGGGNPGSLDGGGTGGIFSAASAGNCVGGGAGSSQGQSSFGRNGGGGGDATTSGGGGGGGGGGFYGGGGGGGGAEITCVFTNFQTTQHTGGAGGGGGASYVTGLDSAGIAAATTTDTTGTPKVSITYTPPTPADVGVAITGAEKLKKGKKATYKITALNNGPGDATSVVTKDKLPKGLKFIGATTTAGHCSATAPRCTTSTLASGDSAVMRVTVKAKKTGKWKQTATVTSDDDLVASNDHDSITTKVKPAG